MRAGETVLYTGAVLEYEPYITWTEEGGEAILRENAKVIAEYAAAAKEMVSAFWFHLWASFFGS